MKTVTTESHAAIQLNSDVNRFRFNPAGFLTKSSMFFFMAFLSVMLIAQVQTATAQKTEKVLQTVSPLKVLPKQPKNRTAQGSRKSGGKAKRGTMKQDEKEETPGDEANRARPRESKLTKAGTFDGDLRDLPKGEIIRQERPEREEPNSPIKNDKSNEGLAPIGSGTAGNNLMPPAPSPLASFGGLDLTNWGSGYPPDTVGDVGPTHFIQAVNASVGIYRKSDQVRLAAFTLNTFMSQGNFGNVCDTNNFGDPVVLYDTFEDRWMIMDFAFILDGSNNVVNPPGVFQCFAVSKTSDPVAGGWNYYSVNTTGGFGDYPKVGIWNDGIYMMVNMFNYAAGGAFQNVRVYALNKAQMYAGKTTVQVVSFDAPSSEFTILPGNARLQTGAPPVGTPNYFAEVWNFANVVSIWKFKADWDRISLSSFTGPFNSIAPASFAGAPGTVPAQGGVAIDTLATRLMMQNQYTNIGGVESVWNTHTVRGSVAAQSAVRYYQVNVTGGTISGSTTQASTYNPDATNRSIPSIAVNRNGDFAIGYSATSSTLFPSLRYAGWLAGDAVNTITQTETDLIAGTGSQNNNSRWGDYSTMTLDPNGCTFWFTSEYYAVTGSNWQTRIGSFAYPGCTPVGVGGTLTGTVTATTGGAPISGATVTFGNRTATTNASGVYTFTNIPAGTYSSLKATFAGKDPGTAASLVINDSGTTTQNFSLPETPVSATLTDTTTSDFQLGLTTNAELTTSANNVVLAQPTLIDQQNTSVTTSGFGFSSTAWFGQTFTAAASGQLTKVDVNLFCSGCTGTTPNITVSIRNTASNLPTGADLATATITGFSSGAGVYYTATFATPPTLASGTQYAIVVRPVSNPSAGTYAYVVSTGSPYAAGQRVTSANSGVSWTGQTTDIGFRTYILGGYSAAGNLISGLKDANPATGQSVRWASLTWNATTPAGTSVQFQLASSNSDDGPFNFIGPDGTAATFFTTSGPLFGAGATIIDTSELAALNNKRYLKYKAYLATTNSANTPVLNDVAIAYTVTTLTSASVPVSGKVTFGKGRALARAAVTLTGADGSLRTVYTNSFGYYRFGDVAIGQYIVSIESKRATFAPQAISVTEAVENLDFAAQP